MKKILFFILLLSALQSQAQRFPSVDSLQTYINKFIRNSTMEAFTNYRLQNVVYGLSEFIGEGTGVDSIWIVDGGANADTLKYRKWAVTYIAGLITGSVGSSTWGGITGTLSNQTDLQTALNLKLNISDTAAMLSPYLRKIDTASLSSRINNAYNSVEGTADSTGLIFIKPNGGRDTVSILGATGGGGGGEVNTASNVGTGAQVFKEKSGVDFRFRSIIGSNGVTATQNTNDVTLSYNIPRGTFAQRPASPDTGQLYWQTDRLAGQWEYDGIEWRFRGVASKFDFNETFSAGAASLVGRLSGLIGGTGSTANIFRQKGGTSYLQLNTGTTTTGYSSYQIAFSEETTLQLDSVITYREFRVRLPILSDGTETYESALGWLGHQSLWSFMTLGFHYTHSNNGGRWETRTRKFDNSANMTVKDTGVPVVAGQWYKMGIEVNGFTNTIYFYIDDVLVATHTSAENIPVPNSTNNNQYNYGIAKQAGTTARVMDVDYAISYIVKQSY